MEAAALHSILNETLERIKAVISPKRVVLFGSAARCDMKEDSDIDLLVIAPTGTHRRRTAQKIYRNMIGVGFAADIVVVTEEDIEQHRDNPGMVIHQALEEGKVLYVA